MTLVEPFESPGPQPRLDPDNPSGWLGSTPLLDLEDTKLRLRAHAVTQLCKSEREKALSIYGYVKRLPFAKPLKMRLHTAREVIAAGRGDADDKSTVLIAMMRAVEIPARIRYIELRGEILRGLTSGVASAVRPVAEIWLNGTWMRTDTYIFDAAYMAAARRRLQDSGWDWGYGIHREGHMIWTAAGDAWLGGMPTAQDPMVMNDMGVFSDPMELAAAPVWRASYPRLARAVQWNVLAPMMERVVRELREEAHTPPAVTTRRA
ncbi:MAG: transglutaminase-like domain-containing protein [Ramlibacter sp.]|nr:transglutaminase-like domain-containing protein [Ramlibacter sp.]